MKNIDGIMLKSMLISGSNNLYNNYADLLATGKASPEQIQRMIGENING